MTFAWEAEHWVELTFQAAPAHIGHPSDYPEGDPDADFLPPAVEYNPDDWNTVWTPRAVIVVDDQSTRGTERSP